MAGKWLGRLVALVVLAGSVPAYAQGEGGPDKIVAWVNSEYISVPEFLDRLQRVRAQDFVASRTPLTMRSESAGMLVLSVLISEKLVLQCAKEEKQLPDEAELNTEVEFQKKQPPIVKALADKIFDEAGLKERLRVQLARYKLAIAGTTVTPQDVEAYYRLNAALFTVPEKWGLTALRTTNAANLPKIKAAIKAGKPFADLVKTYSDDPRSKANGGQMGMVSSTDPGLPEVIRQGVKPLKVGETSQPIRIEFNQGAGKPRGVAWWFFRLVGKEPAVVQPLNTVRLLAERGAALAKGGGYPTADRKVTAFREKSEIRILLEGYDALSKRAKK